MSNNPIYLRLMHYCKHMLKRIIDQWEIIYSVSLLFLFAHFSYKCLFNIASVHLGTFSLPGASYGAP